MASHVFAVRKQLCEFDEHFSVTLGHGLEVELKEPVLLDSEVFLMVGAKPTTTVITTDGMTASYVFEQLRTATGNKESKPFLENSSDPLFDPLFQGEEFEIRFLFKSSDKGFLLSGIQSSEIPTELRDSAVTVIANSAEIAQQACDMPVNPLSRSVVVDIDRDMLNMLPERQSVISWLGAPIELTDNSDDLIYEFRLKGESTHLPVIRVDAGYGRAGETPTEIDASFTRYHASIDVTAATMRVKLHF